MLLGIINDKTNKKEYYINAEKQDTSTKISFIEIDNNSIKELSREEARNLLKTILSSNLTYKEKYGEYDVYLDEANNKRYFKNGKENFLMFLRNNGVSAINYFDKIDKKPSTKRYSIITTTIVFDLILSSTALIPFIGDVYIENGINSIVASIIALDSEEVINSIESSKHLSEEEKEILCNEEYFDFVLRNSDSFRNYQLRENFNDIKIKIVGEDVMGNTDGYYDPLYPNTIYICEKYVNNKTEYEDILTHEFIHMTQSNYGYGYIKEASAEIFKNEFYNQPITAYVESVKRVKTLMEIIGPEAVAECVFKDNNGCFDGKIREYLKEEDANKLIELFKTPWDEISNTPNLNKDIDILLAKMYFNKTGTIMSEDLMIKAIYETGAEGRYYFNGGKSEYANDYLLYTEKELIDVAYKDRRNAQSGNSIEMVNGRYTIPFELEFDVVSEDGTEEYVSHDGKIETYKLIKHYEPAIPNKFPDQVQPINNKDMNKYKKEEVKSM